mmetsp:Transcript_162583/g.521217  ORF Transcript_162583/g.521217 Transcript_162583/m.521217 type:complete len:278 (+) Transcript_162583:184-1017(+)
MVVAEFPRQLKDANFGCKSVELRRATVFTLDLHASAHQRPCLPIAVNLFGRLPCNGGVGVEQLVQGLVRADAGEHADQGEQRLQAVAAADVDPQRARAHTAEAPTNAETDRAEDEAAIRHLPRRGRQVEAAGVEEGFVLHAEALHRLEVRKSDQQRSAHDEGEADIPGSMGNVEEGGHLAGPGHAADHQAATECQADDELAEQRGHLECGLVVAPLSTTAHCRETGQHRGETGGQGRSDVPFRHISFRLRIRRERLCGLREAGCDDACSHEGWHSHP